MRARANAQIPPRLGVRIVAAFIAFQLLLVAALLLLFSSPAGAAPIKGEVTVSTKDGFARLVFALSEETEAEVRLNNGILIIAFRNAVDVPVDKIAAAAANYVSAARRDPDGSAVRLALTRKVTVNSMAAGEKLFVDLLPEGWTGLPPSLPQDVVEELAKRARDAEKRAREEVIAKQRRAFPPIRVRVGAQPTYTRYTFPLPGLIAVTTDRNDERVVFSFEAPLKFDLADAQGGLPTTISAVTAQNGADNASVRFDFIGKVDVRTFREDNNYFVDVIPIAVRSDAADGAKHEAKRTDEPKAPEPAREPEPPRAEAKAPDPKPEPPQVSEPPATIPARESANPAAPSDPVAPVVVDVRRQGEALRLTFPFNVPTPAAVFRRADTIWLVFDSQAPIDINRIAAQSGRIIRSAGVTRSRDGQVIQLKLDKPKLTSVATEGLTWSVVVGDTILDPTQPLSLVRVVQPGARSSVVIPFDQPSQLHRIADDEIGDTLLVVTALGPARGFIKPQELVEFATLVSTHGVVIQPKADDVSAEVSSDKIVVARPGGLMISSAAEQVSTGPAPRDAGSARRPFMLDAQAWGYDRQADFRERQTQLMAEAASAEDAQRTPARLSLARFYLARELMAEAKGVLDITALDPRAAAEGSVFVLRAVAYLMMSRGVDAMKDLSQPSVGDRNDAVLWRAVALAQQGKWTEAREGFRSLYTATATLPVELQRQAFLEAVRAAIEVHDYGAAQTLITELETLGSNPNSGKLLVLKARALEGLGRLAEALALYRVAAESAERPAAARATLRQVALRQSVGDLKRDDAMSALESLTMWWRGDEIETEAMALLGRMYTDDSRYRDAFQLMRTALAAYPNSEITRRIQDEAAVSFESLFLGGKGDAMAPIEALSLFYDFRELTPVGRRGDDMIRKLAERLASVDLLDQAAGLLQHQVDNRLQGAARAQVAVRLAVIYLTARKPDRAIQVLRATRSADLPSELRQQRLLIEARAQSEIGRPELAVEVVANLQGAEVERLRADILWKARRWRDAAEQIEKSFSDRWSNFAPLTDTERADVLRAAIGYALAEDAIGLDRWRTKYAPKMAESPDRRAFEVVTTPFNMNAPEFGEVAKLVASADTLEGFLRDIRAKFPEITGPSTPAAPATPPAPAAAPMRGAAAEGRRPG